MLTLPAVSFALATDLTSPLSLYIHVPFCQVRCNFCNLHTYGMGDYAALPDIRAAYTEAVRREAALWGAQLGPVDVATVFFGGGTPTELSAAQLGAILTAVRQAFSLQPDAEITVEAYPGLSRAYLADLRASGVTRVSFGVQSFVPRLARLLDRQHSGDDVARTVADAHDLGFSVALDLVYGLPTQTAAEWEATLDAALALAPDHLSLYALSIEEATRLRALVKRGALPSPDPDLAADMYRHAQARLAEAGLEHYELSNWARPGHACRHNQVYWRNTPWLGMGAGAYGYLDGARTHNVLAPTHYIEAVGQGRLPIAHREVIAPATAMSETVMLGLRLREGLDLAQFEARFGQRLEDVYAAELAELTGWGLVEVVAGCLRLTERALLVANDVFARFLLEPDRKELDIYPNC